MRREESVVGTGMETLQYGGLGGGGSSGGSRVKPSVVSEEGSMISGRTMAACGKRIDCRSQVAGRGSQVADCRL